MSLIVDMAGVGVVCKVGVVGVMGDVGVVGVVGWTAKLRKLLQALEAAAETAAGCREAAAAEERQQQSRLDGFAESTKNILTSVTYWRQDRRR